VIELCGSWVLLRYQTAINLPPGTYIKAAGAISTQVMVKHRTYTLVREVDESHSTPITG